MTGATAIILNDIRAGESGQKISRLLKFFGVDGRVATVEQLLSLLMEKDAGPIRLLGSAGNFLRLAEKLEAAPEKWKLLQARLHSAFCFVEKNDNNLAGLMAKLAGKSPVQLIPATESRRAVESGSEGAKDFTGVFTGLAVAPVTGAGGTVQTCQIQGLDTAAIIANPEGAVFLRLTFGDRPCFVSKAGVIEIYSPFPGRVFDIRPHFLLAMPAVLYVKWAFAETCWQPPETTACLIIDDPLLRPRYGHLNYEHLLGLMERLNFTTSIAFIPWNWNRNSRQTVRLFHENPARFSLSIHGCDHTAAEYGGDNRDRLAWKSRQAIRRMTRHCQQTGLSHDDIMVFPQGVFSEAAMAALKHVGFIGTVNSEVISADSPPRPVTIADYWNVAVMNYSDFPIFTRRYPWAGVENFAFDILLGKPCIVCIHHNDCHDGYRCLTECLERLNRLNVKLRWTNLAEVVRRSFRQREITPGIVEIEMYGSEIKVENSSVIEKLFRFRKRESAADAIMGIKVGTKPVKWVMAENQAAFEAELNPGEAKTVGVTFKEIPVAEMTEEGLVYAAKVRLRRYLCEVRDNYFPQKMFSK